MDVPQKGIDLKADIDEIYAEWELGNNPLTETLTDNSLIDEHKKFCDTLQQDLDALVSFVETLKETYKKSSTIDDAPVTSSLKYLLETQSKRVVSQTRNLSNRKSFHKYLTSKK